MRAAASGFLYAQAPGSLSRGRCNFQQHDAHIKHHKFDGQNYFLAGTLELEENVNYYRKKRYMALTSSENSVCCRNQNQTATAS